MNTIKFRKAYCTTPYGAVHYWQTGSGPACLLLHQASQTSAEFVDTAELLAENYTVIALDYPGHGRSDDPDRELDVPDFTAATIAVLDAAGVQRAHVCGHHSGAVVAIDLGARYASRVDRVVLSGLGIRTQAGIDAVLNTPMTRDLPVDADGEFLTRTWSVYRRMTSPGVPADTTLKFFTVSLDARTRPYDAHFAVMQWDRDAALEKYRAATLLLCGELDYFAEQPDRLLERMADARMVTIPGGGPFLFYEKPADCAEVIHKFLNSGNDLT